MSFGKVLRELRKNANMTQEQQYKVQRYFLAKATTTTIATSSSIRSILTAKAWTVLNGEHQTRLQRTISQATAHGVYRCMYAPRME